MHDHSIPVTRMELTGHMSSNIVIDFCKILYTLQPCRLANTAASELTETKKLEVPSALVKVSGKSFSQVSSP